MSYWKAVRREEKQHSSSKSMFKCLELIHESGHLPLLNIPSRHFFCYFFFFWPNKCLSFCFCMCVHFFSFEWARWGGSWRGERRNYWRLHCKPYCLKTQNTDFLTKLSFSSCFQDHHLQLYYENPTSTSIFRYCSIAYLWPQSPLLV